MPPARPFAKYGTSKGLRMCMATNGTLITALAKAYRWQEQLESGRYAGVEDLSAGSVRQDAHFCFWVVSRERLEGSCLICDPPWGIGRKVCVV